MGVDWLIATAFQPEFVIITDCELFGKAPRDQFAAWSQLPLVGFIQEFTCAKAEESVMTQAANHTKLPAWEV